MDSEDGLLEILKSDFYLWLIEKVFVLTECIIVDFVFFLQKLSNVGIPDEKLLLLILDNIEEIQLLNKSLVILEE